MDLSSAEMAYLEADIEAVSDTFKIDNDFKADWALRKIKDEYDERDRLIKVAQDHIEELECYVAGLNDKYECKVGYLKSLLFTYFESVPHKETKTQESYKLMSGSLVKKKGSEKIAHDDEKLLAYLKADKAVGYIKVVEKADWAEFKKDLKIIDGVVVDTLTGTVIPPEVCSVEEVPVSYNIKF